MGTFNSMSGIDGDNGIDADAAAAAATRTIHIFCVYSKEGQNSCVRMGQHTFNALARISLVLNCRTALSREGPTLK